MDALKILKSISQWLILTPCYTLRSNSSISGWLRMRTGTWILENKPRYMDFRIFKGRILGFKVLGFGFWIIQCTYSGLYNVFWNEKWATGKCIFWKEQLNYYWYVSDLLFKNNSNVKSICQWSINIL